MIFGGEALELQSLRPWFERHGDEQPRLVNMYGITETTVHVTYRPLRRADLEAGPGSVIGVPIPDLQVYLLDPSGQPVPVGVPGEMYVGGAGVARGYLDRPELTARALRARPVRRRAGRAALPHRRPGAPPRQTATSSTSGRIDHQVKIRGFRIELGEIEAALARHPAVREAVVVAREDAPGRQAAGRLRRRRAIRRPIWSTNCARSCARGCRSTWCPPHFVALDALPLTANGKVDRKALPAPDGERRGGTRSRGSRLRHATEEMVAGVFRAVLDRAGRGPRQLLRPRRPFAHGRADHVEAALRIGPRLALRVLFERQTVSELAEAIDAVAWLASARRQRAVAGDRVEIEL